MSSICPGLVTSSQVCTYQINYFKFFVLLLGLSAISYVPVKAHRLDVHGLVGKIEIVRGRVKTSVMPGVGIGYDFRNPATRSGWSFVPSFVLIGYQDQVEYADSYKKESVVRFYSITSLVARYRIEFNKHFSMDIDAGGALFGLWSPCLALTTSFYHTFNSGTMVGLRLTEHTNGLGHRLGLGIDLSFPIGGWNATKEI